MSGCFVVFCGEYQSQFTRIAFCLKRIKTDGFLAEFNKTNAEYKEQKTGFQTEKKIAITAHVRPLFA